MLSDEVAVRQCRAREKKLLLDLAPGKNDLLLKTGNESRKSSFYFSADPYFPGGRREPARIWRRVMAEFAEPELRRQMAWEKQ